jgi:6-pyruvoyl-tetrahydropterin synthase
MLYEPPHEHEFRVTLTLEGPMNEESFVVDFRAVKRTFRRIVGRRLEGADLDRLFPFPTAEALAVYVWEAMEKFYPLHSVEVREKPHSAAVYFGPSDK